MEGQQLVKVQELKIDSDGHPLQPTVFVEVTLDLIQSHN